MHSVSFTKYRLLTSHVGQAPKSIWALQFFIISYFPSPNPQSHPPPVIQHRGAELICEVEHLCTKEDNISLNYFPTVFEKWTLSEIIGLTGTLVLWNLRRSKEYGSLGVITLNCARNFSVFLLSVISHLLAKILGFDNELLVNFSCVPVMQQDMSLLYVSRMI